MKIFGHFLAFAFFVVLSACTTNEKPGTYTPPSEFLILVRMDEYKDIANEGLTWGWADEESLTTAKVGDELRFVFGYPRGTHRVELKEWNTTGGRVSGLPFILDYDGGNAQAVRTFDWTPGEEGDYYFSLWLSTQSGQPRAGTPIELRVRVGDEDSTPDDELERVIRWFNVTDSDDRPIEDGDKIQPARAAGGVSVNWSVARVDELEVTVTSGGRELFSSDRREHSRWVPFVDINDRNVVVRLRIKDGGRTYTEVIRFEVKR